MNQNLTLKVTFALIGIVGLTQPVQTRAARPARPARVMQKTFGITKPMQQAVMPSLVQAAITKVHVKEGQRVKKGDLLVSLDDALPRAALLVAQVAAQSRAGIDNARVALNQAKKQLARLEQAYRNKASSAFEVEASKASLEQAEAAYRQASEQSASAKASLALRQAELDQYSIRAPFDGTIIQIHSKVGTAVDGSVPVVTVADLSALETEMFLPVSMYGRLQAGKTLTCVAGIPVDRELSGTVTSVSPVINAASKSFRVLIRIENKDSKLPAGFSISIRDSDSKLPAKPAPHRKRRRRSGAAAAVHRHPLRPQQGG